LGNYVSIITLRYRKKLAENKYRFFVSINFDSIKIEELKGIYKNLLFIKDEISKISDEIANP